MALGYLSRAVSYTHLDVYKRQTFLREYDKLAQQCAAEGVDFPRYLLRLSELELLDRERRASERRIRQAKFDVVKSLDTFEFLAIPSLNKSVSYTHLAYLRDGSDTC